MKKIVILLLLAIATGLQGQSLSGPESVDCDTLTNTWYVGNTVSKTILRRNANGAWTNFVSGISSGPYGLEVVGDRIYACVGAGVKGYNLSDGAQVFSASTPGVFLNGLAHDDNGFLYATDFTDKKIYKINTVTAATSVFVTGLASKPNGILYEKAENRLVFATWGSSAKIMAVSMADSSVTTLKTTTFSNIDGIAQDDAGRFYVAHWGGNAVHRFDHNFVQAPVQVASGLSSPADIFYNRQTDTLAIPNSSNNTVKFIGFAPVSGLENPVQVEALSVFPNPASDQVVIESAPNRFHTVQITDALGRPATVSTRQHADQWLLDISTLPRGWYLIIAHGDKGIATGRFVKR